MHKNNDPMSLVEKAKKVILKKKYRSTPIGVTKEQRMELSLAYIRGEIAQTQASKVIWPGKTTTGLVTMFYCFLAHGIRDAYEAGLLQIKKKP